MLTEVKNKLEQVLGVGHGSTLTGKKPPKNSKNFLLVYDGFACFKRHSNFSIVHAQPSLEPSLARRFISTDVKE